VTENSEKPEWSFDTWAETYDQEIATGNSFDRYADILAAVVEVANIRPGSQVLDIGVGTGNLALLCAELGARVVGLDPYKGMLAKAEIKLAGHSDVRLAWCEDPFLSLPSDDASFDAIVSTFAFHHVLHEEKPAAVQELKRALKPGGVVSIGDLMFENAQAETAGLKEHDWLDETEFFSRIDELSDMFAENGMELICQQFTPVAWVVHATRSKES